jgi:hypothetical protein
MTSRCKEYFKALPSQRQHINYPELLNNASRTHFIKGVPHSMQLISGQLCKLTQARISM